MTLQSSGAISLQDIANEASQGTPHVLSELAALFSLAEPDAFSDFYGLSYNPPFDIYPTTTTTYLDSGAYNTWPSYEIDTTIAWYGIVDDSEIGNLSFSPLSYSGYYNGAQFGSSVDSNPTNYTRGGGVAFYNDANDDWVGSIGACQDGYVETCG